MRNRKLSLTALRRTVTRLRAGEIMPSDPTVSPFEAAERIEQEIARRELLWTVVREGRKYENVWRSCADRDEDRRRRHRRRRRKS